MNPIRSLPWSKSLVCAFVAAFIMLAPHSSMAAGDVGPSGLKLPRFVSTRSSPINVRVGPGTRYDVAWVFRQAGLPVEIIQEYDTWRKIRYVDGDEGWVHQNLLVAHRTALVQPFGGKGQAAVRSRPDDDAPLRAWLGSGFLVTIRSCTDGWCAIEVPAEKDHKEIKGNMLEIELWGVYPDEVID